VLQTSPARIQHSRRDLLRWATIAAGAAGASELVAACGGGASSSGGQQPAARSLRAPVADAPQLSILGAQSLLPAGRGCFGFGLAGPTNVLVEGASPQVWLARDQTSRELGPFPARWLKLAAYQQTHDRSRRSQLNGFYLAEVDVPQPGTWQAVAIVEVASQRAAGQGAIKASQQVPAPVGSKALAGPTPVATTATGLAKICTRTPVCPMHAISLDKALRSGRPTVLSFATPLLCTSRMCGPVVDEQILNFHKLGERANFLHLEIYPRRDLSKPAPLYSSWKLPTEPRMFVIDPAGVIRARLDAEPTSPPRSRPPCGRCCHDPAPHARWVTQTRPWPGRPGDAHAAGRVGAAGRLRDQQRGRWCSTCGRPGADPAAPRCPPSSRSTGGPRTRSASSAWTAAKWSTPPAASPPRLASPTRLLPTPTDRRPPSSEPPGCRPPLFIGPDGTLRGRHVGALTASELRAAISRYLHVNVA
jgi:hypothetical protein